MLFSQYKFKFFSGSLKYFFGAIFFSFYVSFIEKRMREYFMLRRLFWFLCCPPSKTATTFFPAERKRNALFEFSICKYLNWTISGIVRNELFISYYLLTYCLYILERGLKLKRFTSCKERHINFIPRQLHVVFNGLYYNICCRASQEIRVFWVKGDTS